MTLNIKTRDQFITDEVTAVQAALPGAFSFPIGSIVRALVDAHSATAIWEQSLIQLVYNRERLATSEGEDADSFVADFGLTRLPAVAASGNVTFSSFVATTQRLINVGSTVTTFDGTANFAVAADENNPSYDPTLEAYVMSPGVLSVDARVVSVEGGIIGNVLANKIVVINSPIVGVDTVTNALAFGNGQNRQTTPELRRFFVDYLNSLSRATRGAINFAVESVQEGLKYTVVDNRNYDTDVEQLGFFYVVVSDADDMLPSSLEANIRSSVEVYRGLSIRYDIHPPIAVPANISANIIKPAGYINPDLAGDIQSALQLYINLIPFGETLHYTRIAQIIYNAILDIAPTLIIDFNVTNILLNGGVADLPSTPRESIRAGTIDISIITPP